MGDLDTVQIVQRQDSGPDVYQALEYKIDPSTYMSPYGNKFRDNKNYAQLVYESELALDLGQEPKLSEKGTSGCYFIHNRMGVSICRKLSHHYRSWYYCGTFLQLNLKK